MVLILLLAQAITISTGDESNDSKPGMDDSARSSTKAEPDKKWTVMVYMAADNNLEYWGIEDMNELEYVGSSDDVNLIVQFDRHPDSNINQGYTNSNGNWADTRRFYIEQDNDLDELYNYKQDENMWLIGETNMAAEQTFKDFLHWSLGNYSAEHFLLVMWDHGEGIFSNGRGGSSGSDQEAKSSTRGICNDETNGGWLDLWEMRSAFQEIKEQYDITIDIISFDICWIGTFETAYELMPYADYFTGSPEEEPNPGWNYYRPISHLITNPGISPADLAVRITTDFKEEYKAEKYTEWKYLTYAAVDLNRFRDHFIPLLNDFADAMSENIYDNHQVITNIWDDTVYPHRRLYMRDLFHFVDMISESEEVSSEIRNAAMALNNEYNNTIMKFVSGSLMSDALGPTIYFPDRSYKNQYNTAFLFSTERWEDFLKLFLTPIQIDHTTLSDSEAKTGEFEVKAIIKGQNLDRANIYLFYEDEKSGAPVPTSMLPTGSPDEYSGYIGIKNYETNVYYYIRTQATNNGNYITSPQNMIDSELSTWHSFYVGTDAEPPVITHRPYIDIEGTLGEPYTFYVNITDNYELDIHELVLCYNKNNSEWFSEIHLEPDIATGRFQGTLPIQNVGTIIYYYFNATDCAEINNTNREPTKGVHSFDVSRKKPEASFSINKLQAYTYELITFTSTSKPKELIKTHFWDFGDGGLGENQEIVTHYYTEANEYTVTLRVTDVNNQWSEVTRKIVIINKPPVAKIKTEPILVNNEAHWVDDDYISDPVYEDDIIELDCTASEDKDGYIMIWTWNFGDGIYYKEIWEDWNLDGRFDSNVDKVVVDTILSSTEQQARLTSSSDGKITYKYYTEGEYTITFIVEDNHNNVSELKTIKVRVQNRVPEPNPGVIYIEDLTVKFMPDKTGSNSIDSPSDIGTLNYTWTFGDGDIGYGPNPEHTYLEQKKYKVKLTVSDDDGAIGEKTFELNLAEDETIDPIMTLGLVLIGILIIFIISFILIINNRNKRIKTLKKLVEEEEPTPTSGTAQSKQIPYQSGQSRFHQIPPTQTPSSTRAEVGPERFRTTSKEGAIKSTPLPTRRSATRAGAGRAQRSSTREDGVKVKDLLTMMKNK